MISRFSEATTAQRMSETRL